MEKPTVSPILIASLSILALSLLVGGILIYQRRISSPENSSSTPTTQADVANPNETIPAVDPRESAPIDETIEEIDNQMKESDVDSYNPEDLSNQNIGL